MMNFYKFFRDSILLFITILFCFFSCGVIDIRPIEMSFNIDNENELPFQFSPLEVYFNAQMQKIETENSVSVKSIIGIVEVDKKWNDNTLVLRPVSGWERGILYTVSISGLLRTEDGREERVLKQTTFHYGELSAQPFLVMFEPQNGAHTGVSAETGAYVRLYFSQSMNMHSVEDAFSINGFSEKEFNWNSEHSILTITNNKNIAPHEIFLWTIKTQAKSEDGLPLVKEISAQWSSDAFPLKPRVAGVYSVIRREAHSVSSWYEIEEWHEGEDVQNILSYDEAIKIKFNKRIDTENILNAIRFEPSLSGRVEVINPETIIFIPERAPSIGVYYTLIVSGETKDESGVKIAEDYKMYFSLAQNFLKPHPAHPITVDSIAVENGSVVVSLPSVEAYLPIVITFNEAFTPEEQINSFNAVRLQKVFPSCALVPTLRTADWGDIGGKTLYMDWSFEAATAPHGHSHFYKLTISGGQNGITNGRGSYLQNNIEFYIEIIETGD